jgi:tetratricopeptide (TPR) repeat protein
MPAAPTTTPDPALQAALAQLMDLLRADRLDAAARDAQVLLDRHPGHPDVLAAAAEVRLRADDGDAALRLLDAAIAATASPLPYLLAKARTLLALRRRDDARRLAAEAAARAGEDPRTLRAIAAIHGRCNDPVTALRFHERALAAGGGNPVLLYDLAASRFFTGDFAGAERALEALLAQAPQTGHALYLRATLRRQTADANHVADLEARLQSGFGEPAGRAACLYALAKELEDLGEDARSFAALQQAATLKRRTLRYDAAAERASIDAIGTAWDAAALRAGAAGDPDPGPIFIVGLPRTGTTLVERMLGRHGTVGAAGELLDFGQALSAAARREQRAHPGISLVEASLRLDFAALGGDYVGGARQAAGGSRRFIDKMPVNFLYCGLIRKALPNARILHLVRDPMDSAYAIYKTLFNQAYHFSYDLGELADYYASYRRLMEHWHAVMPGQILDVHYEDLVTDLAGQARRILDWCGLDWHDAVLDPSRNEAPSTTASAAQVREPVHSRSVGNWRRHEAGLAPLRARLAALGVLDPPPRRA